MGCTLLQRLHHQCGGSVSIPKTCKYKAQVGSDGTVYIIPTINGCTSLIKISVGDAVIQFDTKSPPKFLKATITTGVTKGKHAHEIEFGNTRQNLSYSSAAIKNVPFTDANGKTTQVPLMEITDYHAHSRVRNRVKDMGYRSFRTDTSGRILW